MLNSPVAFQETFLLSRVLAVLELSISVTAEAGGLHSIDCPALCAQTPAQASRLDESQCVQSFHSWKVTIHLFLLLYKYLGI